MADKLVDELKNALGDAYTIERELTGGGMSRVFVAREHALGREVVIKVLPTDLAAGVNRDRFRREVQLAARLSHPYIVPLLHAGEHGELLWFTMPFIHGESLRNRMQRSGPMKFAEVLPILHDVVEALAYAHSRGVIHRDIKPGNILYDGRHAVVTDFGVAKALNAALSLTGPGHTTSGMAIGTPAYMAPEQLAADPKADQRVDLYAVGLLAYELLSGASPFAAPSPTATMAAQLTRIPEPLHESLPDVPQAFSDLVQHLLAKAPDDRPPDAQAVITELDRISGAMAADVHRGLTAQRTRRPSMLPITLASAGVVALVALGFWWVNGRGVKAAGIDTTAANRGGSDTELSATLPVRPLTHQDSLNIAEAFRDQLAQIDPTYQKKPAVAKAIDTVPLDVELHLTDSLIRERLGELYGGRGRGGEPPPMPGAPVAPVTPAAGGSTPQHVAIAISTRREDSTLRALAHDAAVELSRRLSRPGEWQEVTIDSQIQSSRGRGRSQAEPNADVVVYLSFRRDESDSVHLLITVRNSAPGTNFGFRVITSDPVYKPTDIRPFMAPIFAADRLLRDVHRIPAGQPWPQDLGIGANGGSRGPNSSMVRIYTPQQIDSLRHRMDSLHTGRSGESPRRDSAP
ncbi:MAG: serine/threonine-protein kinase [Gemmatimonadales bacterium]